MRRVFPVSVSLRSYRGGKRETGASRLQPIAVSRSADAAAGHQLRQGVGDVAGAHACGLAQLPLGEGRGGFRQDLDDALLGRRLVPIASLGRRWLDDFESERWRVGFEHKLQPVAAGGGAMLDSEVKVLAVATQIKIGIAPGVQL